MFTLIVYLVGFLFNSSYAENNFDSLSFKEKCKRVMKFKERYPDYDKTLGSLEDSKIDAECKKQKRNYQDGKQTDIQPNVGFELYLKCLDREQVRKNESQIIQFCTL